MRLILPPFLSLAALGFFASLATHLLALAGGLPPGGKSVFGLHVGIFVLWVPVVLLVLRLLSMLLAKASVLLLLQNALVDK